ncbi:MAG: hypothetical protein MK078_16325 [Crocinitomicaceae bacterium]|nr:hypothetical protein [Crocinitomicaceae bacterium]
MKKIFILIPLTLLFACGENVALGEEIFEVQDSIYSAENEFVVAAYDFKDKLAGVHASFMERGLKEVEETICSESENVPYSGNPEKRTFG